VTVPPERFFPSEFFWRASSAPPFNDLTSNLAPGSPETPERGLYGRLIFDLGSTALAFFGPVWAVVALFH